MKESSKHKGQRASLESVPVPQMLPSPGGSPCPPAPLPPARPTSRPGCSSQRVFPFLPQALRMRGRVALQTPTACAALIGREDASHLAGAGALTPPTSPPVCRVLFAVRTLHNCSFSQFRGLRPPTVNQSPHAVHQRPGTESSFIQSLCPSAASPSFPSHSPRQPRSALRFCALGFFPLSKPVFLSYQETTVRLMGSLVISGPSWSSSRWCFEPSHRTHRDRRR